MNSIEDRLDTLESVVDEQQAQIEAHEETIAAQQQTIEAQRERLAAVENDGGLSMPISRRGALAAGGALGLLGLGAGTASAESVSPSGQVGTENQPLQNLHTRNITFEKPASSGTFTSISSEEGGDILDFTLGIYEYEDSALRLGRSDGKTLAQFNMNVGAGAFELLETRGEPDEDDIGTNEGMLFISDGTEIDGLGFDPNEGDLIYIYNNGNNFIPYIISPS